MKILYLLFILSTFVLCTTGHEVRGVVAIPAQSADFSSKNAPSASKTVKVFLNGGEYSTETQKDGSFLISGVKAGVYSLELFHSSLVFPTYKINIKDDEPTRVIEYKYPGASRSEAEYPLKIRAVVPAVYFEEKPKMNWFSLLKNPTILMMVVMLGLMFCMKQISNDPESQAEMRRQQEAMGDNPLAALMGAFTGQMPQPSESPRGTPDVRRKAD